MRSLDHETGGGESGDVASLGATWCPSSVPVVVKYPDRKSTLGRKDHNLGS